MSRRRARSPYTPPVIREEDVLLYKSSKEADSIKKDLDLSPEQEKRLSKMEALESEKQDRWAKKVTTRADVIAILSMYIERHLLPMAHRLDMVEKYIEYLELPIHKKTYVKLVRLGKRIHSLYITLKYHLGRPIRAVRRIRFVKLKKGGDDGPERGTEDSTGASVPEGGSGEGQVDEIRDSGANVDDEAG